MPSRLTTLIIAAALAGCAADDAADRDGQADSDSPAGRAEIVAPTDGAVVGPDVDVSLGATGVTVEPAEGTRVPGSGHHHLYIDHDLTPADEPIPADVPGIVHLGTGAAEYTIADLDPGEHRIIAVLAYGDHVPMDDVATDTVDILVEER